MVDVTNPPAGVAAVQPSIEQRMAALIDRDEQAAPASEEKAPEAAPEAKPEPVEATQPESSEPTPEDIPDEAALQAQPDTPDAFEIVHNGTQHKLSREEAIKLAQQGFDYTQKSQALAEKAKVIETLMQRASEVDQIAPMLAQERAQVMAAKAKLDEYASVDWVRLATEQPLEYPRYRAQYDLLVNSFNTGLQRVSQAEQAIGQRKQEIQGEMLKGQFQRLQELVPEWRDPAKFTAGTQEVRSYLLNQGVAPQAVENISDALSVSLARKAMLYDKLVKSKAEKSKLLQTAPPVARPGAPRAPDAAKADKQEEIARRFKKSGSIEDAAALYFQRMK